MQYNLTIKWAKNAIIITICFPMSFLWLSYDFPMIFLEFMELILFDLLRKQELYVYVNKILSSCLRKRKRPSKCNAKLLLITIGNHKKIIGIHREIIKTLWCFLVCVAFVGWSLINYLLKLVNQDIGSIINIIFG